MIRRDRADAQKQDTKEAAPKTDRVTTVADEIRARVLTWKYAPGTRLLENDLSGELGVSRSVMREALRMLEARGLLEKTPNRGYAVRQLDVRAAQELYEMREALETYAVKRLARTGVSPEQLAEWTEMWSTRRLPATTSRDGFAQVDREFHEALAAAAGNATLLSELRHINDRIAIFRVIDFEQESTIRSAREAHRRIVEEIAAGDENAAATAMQENIEHAKRNVRRALGEVVARSYFGEEGDEDE